MEMAMHKEESMSEQMFQTYSLEDGVRVRVSNQETDSKEKGTHILSRMKSLKRSSGEISDFLSKP
jgi:hypothetical protein